MRFVMEQHQRDWLLRDRIDIWVVSLGGRDLQYDHGLYLERNLLGGREVLKAETLPPDEKAALETMRAVLAEFFKEAGIK